MGEFPYYPELKRQNLEPSIDVLIEVRRDLSIDKSSTRTESANSVLVEVRRDLSIVLILFLFCLLMVFLFCLLMVFHRLH